MNERTHASFFSGAGGLDLGLERAGWRTVSFSEIDPYACAVLAERWPGVPNLGDITRLAGVDGAPRPLVSEGGWYGPAGSATLWTGGFPCQDLSIAGKRRGLGIDYILNPNDDPEHGPAIEQSFKTRSGLAFAYLGLVERWRPPWVLLENVPGLLSSNRGRDLSVLYGRLAELGYGVAHRVLDARYFGVAQRRRRVFILASRDPGGRAGADRASEVLSIAASGGGHPAAGGQEGPGIAGGADDGAHDARFFSATAAFGDWESGDVAGTLSRRDYKSTNHLIVPRSIDDARRERGRRQGAADLREREPDPRDEPDADAVRRPLGTPADASRDGAPDGLAGRPHDRSGVAATLNSGGNNGGFRTEPGEHLTSGRAGLDDPLLPLGLDSHRYRCCGNGVVSNVAKALGWALDFVIARDEVVAA